MILAHINTEIVIGLIISHLPLMNPTSTRSTRVIFPECAHPSRPLGKSHHYTQSLHSLQQGNYSPCSPSIYFMVAALGL